MRGLFRDESMGMRRWKGFLGVGSIGREVEGEQGREGGGRDRVG